MAFLSFIPTWLIVVLLIVLIIALFMKLVNTNDIFVIAFLKERLFYILVFLFLAIFIISIINIHSTHDINLFTAGGAKLAAKLYYNWFANFFSNIVKVTGYAIHQDWITPSNSTG